MKHNDESAEESKKIEVEEELYWLFVEQSSDPNQPPFYEHPLKNGGTQWRMSDSLVMRLRTLQSAGDLSKETTYAIAALDQGIRRLERVRRLGMPNVDSENAPPTALEGEMAFRHFILPLAGFFANMESGTASEVLRCKRQALEWVAMIINESYPSFLKTSRVKRDVIDIIYTAYYLCKSLGRIPNKSEIRDELRKETGDRWDFEDDTWRLRWLAAGLSDLEQGRGY